MPYLDGVAQPAIAIDREPCATFHMEVASARQFQGGFGIARKEVEKSREHVMVIFEVGRELPKQRPEFFVQLEHAGCEEIRQRYLDIAQPQHVGDEARTLDREHEAVWRLLAPARVASRPLQRIERAVQFDGGKIPRRVMQLVTLDPAFRVKHPAPRRVTPSRNADANASHALHWTGAWLIAG